SSKRDVYSAHASSHVLHTYITTSPCLFHRPPRPPREAVARGSRVAPVGHESLQTPARRDVPRTPAPDRGSLATGSAAPATGVRQDRKRIRMNTTQEKLMHAGVRSQ